MDDQSLFFEQQESMQPPPEAIKKPGEIKKPSPMKLVVFGIMGVVGLVLVAGVAYQQFFAPPPAEIVEVGPNPTPSIKTEEPLLEKEMNNIQNLLEDSSPTLPVVPPPPVDMQVSF